MCYSEGLLKQVNSFLVFSFIAGDVKGLGPVSILPHLSVKGRSVMRVLLVTSPMQTGFVGACQALMFVLDQ